MGEKRDWSRIEKYLGKSETVKGDELENYKDSEGHYDVNKMIEDVKKMTQDAIKKNEERIIEVIQKREEQKKKILEEYDKNIEECERQIKEADKIHAENRKEIGRRYGEKKVSDFKAYVDKLISSANSYTFMDKIMKRNKPVAAQKLIYEHGNYMLKLMEDSPDEFKKEIIRYANEAISRLKK